MGKWVQKLKENDGLKMLTAWTVILLLIIILGISRLFYTVNIQEAGFAGYYLEQRSKGTLCIIRFWKFRRMERVLLGMKYG